MIYVKSDQFRMKLTEQQRIIQVESEYEILGFPLAADIVLNGKRAGILCYYFKRFQDKSTNTVAILKESGTKKITYDVWRAGNGLFHRTDGPAYFCLFDSEFNIQPRKEYWINGNELSEVEVWTIFKEKL